MNDKPIRVLIASDGSPSAERAIALVECVSWPTGTELRLITVAAPMPAALPAELSPAGTEVERQVRSVGGYNVEVVLRVGRAASCIVDEAKDWQAELVILGSRGLGPLGSALLGSVASEVVNAAREQHEELSAARARSFARPNGKVSHGVRDGDPARELLSEAAEHHTDLIVLGSHGRTGLGRLLLGSVARKVLLHAPCSVLIVRRQAA